MKKSIVFILLFFSIFIFNVKNVNAIEQNPKYFFNTEFTYDKKGYLLDDPLMVVLCVSKGSNSSGMTSCSYYDSNEEKYTTSGYYNQVSLCPNDDDVSDCVTKFYINDGYDSDFNKLKKLLESTKCKTSKMTCYQYVQEQYCKKAGNSSTDLCKAVEKNDGSGYTELDGSTVCKSDVNLRGSDRKFSISLQYFPKNNKRDAYINLFHDGTKTDNGGGTDFTVIDGGDYYKKDNNEFYMHGLNQSYDDFKKELLKAYEKNDKKCDNLLVFCCDPEPGSRKWFSVVGTSCPSEYGDLCQQSFADGKADHNIQYSPNETHYAHSLFDNALDILDCKTLFGGDGEDSTLLDIIKFLFNAIKILVPIILLVLGSIDFIKAIFAQDEGAIKKAQATFIKRLIIAVAIFLIPSVLKALLNIASGIWPNVITPDSSGNFFCGIL